MLLVTQYVMLFDVFKNVGVNNIFQHFAANAHKRHWTELGRHAYHYSFYFHVSTLSHYIGIAEKARPVKAGNHILHYHLNEEEIPAQWTVVT